MSELRVKKIEKLLTDAFKPQVLEVIDDSRHHIGHSGNISGAGHFTVRIKADSFIR